MAEEIRYDHENIKSIASALRDQADALKRDAVEGADAAMAAIKEEASRYTRSGNAAPIYSDVLANADKALKAIKDKATQLADAMLSHASTLDAGVSGAQAVEEDSAAALNSTDTDMQ